FQLAGRVTVKVARVDLERAKIDFTLDETAAPAESHPVTPRRPAIAEPLAREHRAAASAGRKKRARAAPRTRGNETRGSGRSRKSRRA
ncbi:MAG: hypothetical protein ACM34F_03115, partial [Betaproteobacteria bacterium]